MTESYSKHISSTIAQLRKDCNMSLDEMGALINVSGRTVRRWEKGEAFPTIDDLDRICRAFDLPMDEFLHTHENDVQPLPAQQQHLATTATANTLTYVWILIVHLSTAAIVYLADRMDIIPPFIAFIASTAYSVFLIYMIIKYRKDKLFLTMVIVYSAALLINDVLWNIRLMSNSSQFDVFQKIYNEPLTVILNEPVFGFSLLFHFSNYTWMIEGCCVYAIWIVLSLLFLLEQVFNEKFGIAMNLYNTGFILLGVLMIISIVAIPYQSFTYFTKPHYHTFLYDTHALVIMLPTAIGMITFEFIKDKHPSLRRWFHYLSWILVYMIAAELSYVNPDAENAEFTHRLAGYYTVIIPPVIAAVLQLVEDLFSYYSLRITRKEPSNK